MLLGCKETFNTYGIKNNTSYELKVIGYDKYSHKTEGLVVNTLPFYNETFAVKANDLFLKIKDLGEDGGGDLGIFNSTQVDSVVIFFGNEKKIVYVCTNVNTPNCAGRNLLNWNAYYDKNCDRSTGCDYIYTITQEDYDNAESIK